ncbi:phosphoglycerate mutase-like protein [Trichoderma novae-zelandiae]
MHLILIRHGETVDNVAGIYAGSRDSALTSHGVLQIRRLATHLAEDGESALDFIFSSDLQRAVKTAEAIAAEQKRVHSRDIPVVEFAELREKDFGSDEGIKFGDSRGRAPDSETSESMKARVDVFLDECLLPLLGSRTDGASTSTCAIVSHGIILGVLYRELCARVSRGGITVDPNPSAASSLISPPFWDNTGFLKCTVSMAEAVAGEDKSLSLRLHVSLVNCTIHLRDLKKTRGGIGSAPFDEKQRTLTSFFLSGPSKKRKSHDMTAG